jgi:hypothetical protein
MQGVRLLPLCWMMVWFGGCATCVIHFLCQVASFVGLWAVGCGLWLCGERASRLSGPRSLEVVLQQTLYAPSSHAPSPSTHTAPRARCYGPWWWGQASGCGRTMRRAKRLCVMGARKAALALSQHTHTHIPPNTHDLVPPRTASTLTTATRPPPPAKQQLP